MMKKNSSLVLLALFLFAGLVSCVKKVDPLQTNTVTVTFANSGAKFITNDITVNPKDSIFFDFTITSPRDMKYVTIQKNGTDISRDTLTTATKNSFSAVRKFAADSAAGVYNYKVVAKDAGGIYVGDKQVVVTVTADFTFYSFKTLYVPDTTAKTNQTYFSTTTGQTFSYSNASTALIDFGYLYDTAAANKHTIYALNTSPLPSQVSFYDISAWPKNATVFKKITTPTFANLTSAAALRAAGISNLASGTATKITALTAGNVVLFKTAAGKYGAIQVNYTSADTPYATTYMSIDVKIER